MFLFQADGLHQGYTRPFSFERPGLSRSHAGAAAWHLRGRILLRSLSDQADPCKTIEESAWSRKDRAEYEDFYIYITAHEYKHFYQGGTGLRNLVDRYIFLEHYKEVLDHEYIEHELKKMDIQDYEKNSRQLCQKMFEGKKLSDDEKALLDYYIFSGSYGTTENLVKNTLEIKYNNKGGRFYYLLDRFLVPVRKSDPYYRSYSVQYPLFYKHKILLPTLPFYRLLRALCKSRGRLITEIKTAFKL